MGAADTDLGTKWMLPYHASLTTDGSGNVTIIDADGTQRVFAKDATSTPQTYTANKEDAVLISDGTDFILTRFGGDKWYWDFSTKLLKKIVSRTTHEITLTRDGSNRISKVTDGFGRETFFYYITFSSLTRLNEIRESAPGDVGFQSTFLGYDSSGRLIAITNPMGETTRFDWDSSSRISKAYDGHGHATEYTYGTGNKVTNVKDPALSSTAISYGPNSTTVTNRLSKTTVFAINLSGQITKITDALSNDTEFTYDSTSWETLTILGHKIPVSGTPWSRHKTILTYNSGANKHELQKQEIKKITDTDSTGTLLAKLEWTYNALHDILTQKDPLDNVTTYTYELDGGSNSLGLVKTVVNDLSQTVLTNGYDNSTNKYRLLTSKNGVDKTTSFAYDQNTANSYGTPDKITMPSGAITNLKVDIRGRVYENTGPSGNTDKFDFDALDRMVKHTNPDSTSTSTVYDCCHLSAEIDENGVGTTYEHDIMGRLSKVTDANGEETTFAYNAEGWQTGVTDPRGNTTTTTFDDIGRPTQIDYPGGWQELFTYFEPGMVKTKKNKKGASEDTVTYEYDDLYYLKKKDFTSGTDTEITTDAAGRRTKLKDASGEKRYTYDDANRLTKIEQGPQGFVIGTDHNYVLEYTWNAASQKTQTKLTLRGGSAKTWDYAYTDDGQLDTVTNPDGDVTKHEYLTDGRVKKITLRNTSSTTKTTRESFYQDTDSSHAYVANKNKHLRKVLDKKQAGTVITSFDYELDKAGIRLSMTDKDSKYWRYGYDPLYQLKMETKWSAKAPGTREYQYSFVYDANGNRIIQFADGVETDYVYGTNNEMTDAGSDDFTYDHFGNTKTKVSGGNTTTYNWDFESHLTSIDFPGTSNDDTHEYDGDGRRMRSKLNGATNWTNFVQDELSGSLLAEYTLISGTFTIKCLYTNGLGLISTNREGTKRYFHFDGLGSTYALSDESENLKDSYSYSAFGVTISATSTNGPSTNPNRFVGRWGYYDDGAMGSANSSFVLSAERFFQVAVGRYFSAAGDSDQNWYTPAEFDGGDMGNEPPCEKPWKYVFVTCYGTGGEAGGNVVHCGKPRPPRSGDCAVNIIAAKRVCQLRDRVDIRRRGETRILKSCQVCDVGYNVSIDVFFPVPDSQCESRGSWHTGKYCVRCNKAR
ncbi:MAG: hypothetical protein U0R49_02095 [Fimbriimonadales bacterium]